MTLLKVGLILVFVGRIKIGLVFGFCGCHFIGIGLVLVCHFPESGISSLDVRSAEASPQNFTLPDAFEMCCAKANGLALKKVAR